MFCSHFFILSYSCIKSFGFALRWSGSGSDRIRIRPLIKRGMFRWKETFLSNIFPFLLSFKVILSNGCNLYFDTMYMNCFDFSHLNFFMLFFPCFTSLFSMKTFWLLIQIHVTFPFYIFLTILPSSGAAKLWAEPSYFFPNFIYEGCVIVCRCEAPLWTCLSFTQTV